MSLRVPFDPKYTALVGTAVYVFAYYEWVIIYIVEQFRPGFVARYSRGKPLTSGQVRRELEFVLNNATTTYAAVSRAELKACHARFSELIEKRNALIHAHPITDSDGSQILNRQARVDGPLPDMRWSLAAVNDVLVEFDAAAVEAGALYDRLLQRG